MPRHLHIGVGNFHLAHQATYTDKVNQRDGTDWFVTGISMRRPNIRDEFAVSGQVYVLGVRTLQDTHWRRMQVHDQIVVLPENPLACIDLISDPETKAVTLTVTEKAYGAELDRSIASEVRKLGGAGVPKDFKLTPVALLALGLSNRAKRVGHQDGPLPIVCCDNLPSNGQMLASRVEAFASLAELSIDRDVAVFPDAMVDRITPATRPEHRQEALEALGFEHGPVVTTEEFSDWVIQDNLGTHAPNWAAAGARLVQDVAPYELRKLCMLNGAHSLLAYVGLRSNLTFVHEATQDPKIAGLLHAFFRESTRILPPEVQDTSGEYASALVRRFANSAMKHRLDQIAIDGMTKMSARLVPVMEVSASQGIKCPTAAYAIASWIMWVCEGIWDGQEPDDPALQTVLANLPVVGRNSAALPNSLLSLVGFPNAAERQVETALNEILAKEMRTQ